MTADNLADSDTVVGLAVWAAGVLVSYWTIRTGSSMLYRQLSVAGPHGVLWLLATVAAVIVPVAVGLLALGITLEFVHGRGEPLAAGKTTYTLLGGGGLLGTAFATFTISAGWRTVVPAVTRWPSSGIGEAVFALAVIALPVGYASYRIWRPASEPITARQTPQSQSMDPEVVRKATVTQTDVQQPDRPTTPDNDDESEDSKHPDVSEFEYSWTDSVDVSMDDVGGMEDVKAELERDIIRPLTTEKEAADALDIPLPNLLFYGPPGTGKTFLAKAVANELDLPFAQLSGSDVQSKWINESASKIKTLFEESKTIAATEGGAVVFLDEIDAVLNRRSDGQSHAEDDKVVAEFLNHLQQTAEHDVLFIGSTNRIDVLDEAAIRAGRIDKKIEVGEPDCEAREAIIRAQLADRPHALTDDQIRTLAAETQGFVAADIESLVIDAARTAVFDRDDDCIRWEDIQQ